jgi:hypothetical protein
MDPCGEARFLRAERADDIYGKGEVVGDVIAPAITE